MLTKESCQKLKRALRDSNTAELSEIINDHNKNLLNDQLPQCDLNPLHYACQKGSLTSVNLLLDKGIDASIKTKQGCTILHSTCIGGNIDILTKILKLPASVVPPNAVTDQGDIALHFFSEFFPNSESSISLLKTLMVDTNLDSQNSWGETPLHKAALTRKVRFVETLLAAGANPNLTNKNLESPLHTLLKREENSSEKKKSSSQIVGYNPQIWEQDTKAIFNLLIKYGADVTLKTRAGLTARQMTNTEFYSKILFDEEVLSTWLSRLELLHLVPKFRIEHITTDVIPALDSSSLGSVGITEFGYKAKILKKENQEMISKIEIELRGNVDIAEPSMIVRSAACKVNDNNLRRAQSDMEEVKRRKMEVKANNTLQTKLPSKESSESEESESQEDESEEEESEDESSYDSDEYTSGSGSDYSDSSDEEISSFERLKSKSWVLKPDEVVMGELLGKGSSAIVKKGRWTGINVAVKMMNRGCNVNKFEEEIRLMASLRHNNIVNFYGACLEPFFFVIEFAGKGDLHGLLQKESVSWLRRLQLAKDTACGMTYLHQRDIIHRDMKSMNILVTESYQAKVADFGLSKHLAEHSAQMSAGNFPTLAWAAPELIDTNSYSRETDVYAYGVILWEIVTGNYPWVGVKVVDLLTAIKKNQRPPIPDTCETEYKKFIELCWDQDPKIRPSFEQIVGRLDDFIEKEKERLVKEPALKSTETKTDDVAPKKKKKQKTTTKKKKEKKEGSGSSVTKDKKPKEKSSTKIHKSKTKSKSEIKAESVKAGSKTTLRRSQRHRRLMDLHELSESTKTHLSAVVGPKAFNNEVPEQPTASGALKVALAGNMILGSTKNL